MRINWLRIFRKKKDFADMSKKDKKEFFSNDFIDRMIRVEQNVASSLGDKKKHYHKTEYYKSLTSSEKEGFNKYLKKKQNFSKIIFLGFLSVFVLAFFSNQGATGNVISDVADGGELSFLSFSFIALFFIAILISSFLLLRLKRKDKKFKMHFDILNDIRLKREVAKRDI